MVKKGTCFFCLMIFLKIFFNDFLYHLNFVSNSSVGYCFAYLCFHYHFLTNTLQPAPHIRTSAIVMNVPKEILEMAKVFSNKQVQDANGEGNAPIITGIPLHVVLFNKLHDMAGHVTKCSSEVVREVKRELEDCFVGGNQFQANVMLNQVQKIQSEMQDILVNIRNGGYAMTSQSGGNIASVEVDEGNSRHRMYYWGGEISQCTGGV